MNPKLQESFKSRIPLSLRKRNGIIYFQLQIDVAREDGLCAGTYCEFSKIESTKTLYEIGKLALSLLMRFHQFSDLSLEEFYQLTGVKMAEYEKKEAEDRLSFMGASNSDELERKSERCSISYDLTTGAYNFGLSWFYKKGSRYYIDFSDSTGEKGILTFDEPLEFDDNVSPERLGEMILEAFDRSKKMAEITSSKTCPPKQIELLEGAIIEVTPPKDKHFADYNDAGVGELYQVYSYISKEGADSSADFTLSVAPELYEELTCDNIRSAWTEAYGKSELLDVREVQYGIYNFRAEMRSSKSHRIAYFSKQNEDGTLECCMDLTSPNKRKKLDEKLSRLFEKFALSCKYVK